MMCAHQADAAVPFRQVRAVFDARTIRVYQAYAPEIATKALLAQTFVPPFKRERMTWIKPSFTWMMYRSGWGKKPGQEVVLGIDILREGFEWALSHASIAHSDPSSPLLAEERRRILEASPVRVQWDPERTLDLEPLPWRAIQIGLGGEAVDAYVKEWIVRIEDVTPLASLIEARVTAGDPVGAESLRPIERAYALPKQIADRIECRELENGDRAP